MAFSQDDTSVSKMENLLTCPICLEILKDPRTLPCFHSFCVHCLERFVKKQRDQALYVEIEEFNCPTCRSIFPLKSNENVANMTCNYVICNMLEHFLTKSNADKDGDDQRRQALKTGLEYLEDKLKEESEALQAVSNATQRLKENFARAKDEVERDKEEVLQAFSRKLEQKVQGITNDLNQKYNESFQSLSKQSEALDSHVNKLKTSLDIFKNIFESGNLDDTPPGQRTIEETVKKLEEERPQIIKPVHDGSIHYQRKPIGIEEKFTDDLFDDLLGEADVSSSNKESARNYQENQVNKRDDVLLRDVGNPKFVSETKKKKNEHFQQPKAVSSPQKWQPKRINPFEKFVSGQIRLLGYDPGLLDEISIHMAMYLSHCIYNEEDLKVVSDVLFEKCVSEQNFQYVGSRLANHLDKSLNPAGLPEKAFQTIFFKRCQVENRKVGDMIQNNINRVFNFALFLGELLMNYKTVDSPIKLFCIVLDIIQRLLGSNNGRLLICAGKLLKLTGSVLDENQPEWLFQTVKQMASNPDVDRTVRDLFTRVVQLRSTNWGRDEKLSPQSTSLYIPDLGTSLEEQYDASPVVNQEQWSEFAVDSEEDTDNEPEDIEKFYERIHKQNTALDNCAEKKNEKKKTSRKPRPMTAGHVSSNKRYPTVAGIKERTAEQRNEKFYKGMSLNQPLTRNVCPPRFATTDNRGSSYLRDADEDDYDAEYEYFLQITHQWQ